MTHQNPKPKTLDIQLAKHSISDHLQLQTSKKQYTLTERQIHFTGIYNKKQNPEKQETNK
jgi:hypothetical protein